MAKQLFDNSAVSANVGRKDRIIKSNFAIQFGLAPNLTEDAFNKAVSDMDLEVYTEAYLQQLNEDLVKGRADGSINDEGLEKAKKDLGKLIKTVVTDKNGDRRTVYVARKEYSSHTQHNKSEIEATIKRQESLLANPKSPASAKKRAQEILKVERAKLGGGGEKVELPKQGAKRDQFGKLGSADDPIKRMSTDTLSQLHKRLGNQEYPSPSEQRQFKQISQELKLRKKQLDERKQREGGEKKEEPNKSNVSLSKLTLKELKQSPGDNYPAGTHTIDPLTREQADVLKQKLGLSGGLEGKSGLASRDDEDDDNFIAIQSDEETGDYYLTAGPKSTKAVRTALGMHAKEEPKPTQSSPNSQRAHNLSKVADKSGNRAAHQLAMDTHKKTAEAHRKSGNEAEARKHDDKAADHEGFLSGGKSGGKPAPKSLDDVTKETKAGLLAHIQKHYDERDHDFLLRNASRLSNDRNFKNKSTAEIVSAVAKHHDVHEKPEPNKKKWEDYKGGGTADQKKQAFDLGISEEDDRKLRSLSRAAYDAAQNDGKPHTAESHNKVVELSRAAEKAHTKAGLTQDAEGLGRMAKIHEEKAKEKSTTSYKEQEKKAQAATPVITDKSLTSLDYDDITDKDRSRVDGIIDKGKGDRAKEVQLATTMANSITDAKKAYTRYMAAEDQNYHNVAEVFYRRAHELSRAKKA